MSESDELGWERERMPVVEELREEYRESAPLDGLTVGVATHVEQKTGVYVELLLAAGAEVLFTANDFGSIPTSPERSSVPASRRRRASTGSRRWTTRASSRSRSTRSTTPG